MAETAILLSVEAHDADAAMTATEEILPPAGIEDDDPAYGGFQLEQALNGRFHVQLAVYSQHLDQLLDNIAGNAEGNRAGYRDLSGDHVAVGVQHPLNTDGTFAAHCNVCGHYEDDLPYMPPVDYLCEGCQDPGPDEDVEVDEDPSQG